MFKQKSKILTLAKRVSLLAIPVIVVVAGLFVHFGRSNRVEAAASSTVNFQARLLNASGSVVPDGLYNIEFKIYNALTSSGSSQGSCSGDSACLWAETRINSDRVRTVNGYLTVNLGSVTAFGAINWDQELWLSMRVGGTAGSPSWDPEMSPRLKLTAVPYAFRAGALAGGTGANTTVLTTGTPSGNNTLQLPAESGTLCVQNSANCGFMTGSTGDFIQNGTSLQTSANFYIQSAGASSVGGIIRGHASQTSSLFQLLDGSSGLTVAQFTNNGYLQLGSDGISRTGQIIFHDGTLSNTNTVTLIAPTAVSGSSKTITLPDETGTLCIQSSVSCGFLTGSAADYIQNQNASQQASSNFWISGTGRADVALTAPRFDTPTGVGLVIGDTNATSILIGKSSGSNIQTAIYGQTLSKATVDTTTIFRVQNAQGNTAINVDTTSPNLITNSSFEGLGTTGWSAHNGSTISQSVLAHYDNDASLLVQASGTGHGVRFAYPLTAGPAYSLSFFVRASTGDFSTLQIGYSSDGSADTQCATAQSAVTSQWVRITCSNFTLGSVSGSPYVYIKQTDGATRDWWVDAVQLEQAAATTPYRNGKVSINNSLVINGGPLDAAASTSALQIKALHGGDGLKIYGSGENNIFNSMLDIRSADDTVSYLSVNESSRMTQIQGGSGFFNTAALHAVAIDGGSTALRVRSGNGQTADIFQVQTWNGSSATTVVSVGNTGVLSAGVGMAVGTSSSTTGSIAFRGSGGAGILTLQGPTTPNASNYTLSLPAITGNATVCTDNSVCTGYAPASGSANYIQNTTTVQTSANFAIRSAATGSIGAVIQGANGQTADIFQVQTWNGTTSSTVFNVASSGAANFRPGANSTSSFNIQNASSGNIFTVDTTNSRVGINLGGAVTPTLSASGLEINGALRLSGTDVDQFTTTKPEPDQVPTKIHVPAFDPGAFGQIIAFGLPSGAQATARAISVFDARSSTHQPSIAVLSPDENQIGGLSWDGSNTAFRVKNSVAGTIALNVAGVDRVTANTTGAEINGSLGVLGNIISTGNGSFGSSGNYGIVTLNMQSQDGFSSGLRVQKRGNAGDINGAVASSSELGYHEFYGWNGTSYARGSYVITRATEAWSGSAQGTSYAIATTRNGTTTNSEVMTLNHNGAAVFRNSQDSATAFQVQNALNTSTVFNVDTSNNRIGINTNSTAPTADLSFGEAADRTINVLTRASNAAGRSLTIQGGAGGAGASANQGGALILQGGAGGGTNGNGGNVNVTGGAGVGNGVRGLVVISTPTFSTVTNSNCSFDCVLDQPNVDSNGAVIVSAINPNLTVTLPDPTITTPGRIVYVTAADGSEDFTLSVNGGGTGNQIAMRQNTTATMIWNGDDWTAAGASSSTTLQAAYDNTLASAGGAEIILNNTATSNGLTVRNGASNPIIGGGLLEVQTSIGTNLFSVNNNISELVANGGGEDSSTFATNWTSGGTATISRTVTAGQFATGAAGVSVSSSTANSGVRNNLASNPATSTRYLISFTAKLGSGAAFTDLRVEYTPTGAAPGSGTSCITGQTIVTAGWTRITCEFQTPGTSVTNPDIVISQVAAPGGTRVFYIDNLSMTLADDAGGIPNNVQIGGGIYGGAPTLFTLDRSSAPPVANGNETYLGSMYYDTSTGRIQCYESDGWGACGSSPDNIITLTPEYTGAVLNGSGIGTMTADFCANSAALTVGTLCSSGEARNFYEWTSPQASQQVYSIYVTFKLPSTFKNFADDNTITLTAQRSSSDAAVTYEVYKSTGTGITACGSETTVTTSDDDWQTVPINGNENTTCAFAGSNYVIFKINVKAQNNATAYVENLNFTYTNN